ncbi:MAG: sugar phosphate isomerase/epimerase [Oscillospiraceae bacterium]|nr:sugar phosphate isomerase/epimerase [Oscillospiraceae bacterium]
MFLSVSTAGIEPKIGMENAIRAIKKAGFDAFDLSLHNLKADGNPVESDSYMDFAKRVKKAADEAEIICNQSHATFPPEKFGDEEYNKATFEKIRREMEIAAYVGAPVIVVHATKPMPKGYDAAEENLRFYRSLIPFCKEYGIKVAVENLFEWDELRDRRKPCGIGTSEKLSAFMEKLPKEQFTVCFDVGHAAINVENPEDAIRNLKGKIGCLHIHDNDFVVDRHLVPYLGKADWDEICRALVETGYSGDFTLETVHFDGAFPEELIGVALEFEAKVGRHLINKIKKYKGE